MQVQYRQERQKNTRNRGSAAEEAAEVVGCRPTHQAVVEEEVEEEEHRWRQA